MIFAITPKAVSRYSVWLLFAILFSFIISSSIHSQTFIDRSHLLSPMTNGSEWGTTAADFNNDGWIDIYEREKLYINRGGERFEDIYANTGLSPAGGVFGAVFGDYNNDGYLDLLFENFGPESRLFKNNRNLTFTYANQEANLNISILTQTCGWADFNLDGKLDLFVNDDRGRNMMFLNVDYKSFQDISASSNAPTVGNSYGMSWGDFNNDRYPDVFVGTCPGGFQNHLLKNMGNETFSNIGASAGINDVSSTWGVIWLDYNNDGFLDVYLANTSSDPNILYHNNGDETFTDVSATAGVTTNGGFGAAAADFNNDGWVDLYTATSGPVHKLYRNNRDGTFTDMAPLAGIGEDRHNAVAVADFNNDGWMDIFTAGTPQNRLLINRGGTYHWIKIKTRGVQSNYYGVSARVEVHSNGTMQIKDVTAGDSFCSQNELLNSHFGVGTATNIDSIIVRWPSGTVDVLDNIPADQIITIVEGIGLNHTPETFSLNFPPDASQFSGASVDLRWHTAPNPEIETLHYNVYINGPNVDTAFVAIPDTTFSVDAYLFQPNTPYKWTVDATDGFSIIASRDLYQFSVIPDSTLTSTGGPDVAPNGFELLQNYPNPFNPETKIAFRLPELGPVKLHIFDLLGREIRLLLDDSRAPGSYELSWDGRDNRGAAVGSGVYIYRLEAGNQALSRKMLLVR